MRIVTTVEIDVDVKSLAKLFADMDDDQQTRFFVEVARIASAWPDPGRQWDFIGGHLQHCECATAEAREMILAIAHGIRTSAHGKPVEPLVD